MSRRDMIIIAALLNSAIIAVLLMMAVTSDDEIAHPAPSFATQSGSEAMKKAVPDKVETISLQANPLRDPVTIDLETTSLDGLLNAYAADADELFIIEDDLQLITEPPKPEAPKPAPAIPSGELAGVKIVDITVKRGDSLDKIARANDTTIDAIKRLNQLKSEKLSIGQQLKVPVNYKKSSKAIAVKEASTVAATTTTANAEYYTVKSGDSPWKIAKQFHLDNDELLRLNQLDEEKARNLKIGDKIRIR